MEFDTRPPHGSKGGDSGEEKKKIEKIRKGKGKWKKQEVIPLP